MSWAIHVMCRQPVSYQQEKHFPGVQYSKACRESETLSDIVKQLTKEVIHIYYLYSQTAWLDHDNIKAKIFYSNINSCN